VTGTWYERYSESERIGHTIKRPPDLEALIDTRLSSGGYPDVEDVLRRALEALPCAAIPGPASQSVPFVSGR